MKLNRIILMGLSVVMAVGVAGCGAKESGTIKIGLITPKSGPVAQYGIAVENATNLAFEEINAAGGINGKKVELITYDDKGDATESMNVFNRLVDNDKVVALLGPVISSTTLAVAPLADERKIPMITPTATSLDVTLNRPYVFRACYTDPYQGGIAAKFASDQLSAKTAAILYNSGDDYSVGLAEAFKATFEAAGGTITSYEGYTADTKDFKSVLTKIKENTPQVLFNPDYYNGVGLIASQVKEVGLETVMLGGDGWDGIQKDYIKVVEGYYFVNHYATTDPDPVVQNFIKAYEDKFKETPTALGALGYDGAKVMLEAIKKAGSTDSEKILAAMQATNLKCVTGNITFDENGDPKKSVSIIKIENGALKLETKVE